MKLRSHTLEFKRLVKLYPRFQLGPLDMRIPSGNAVGLVGPNGVGKTTIINVASGLIKPDSGEVIVLGEEISQLTSAGRAQIGLVRDEPAFAEHAKVSHLLRFASRFYARWDDRILEGWLQRFRIDVSKTVKELSKGAKLKLQIVMALCHEVELLLLDEPFAGLDLVARADLREAIQNIRETRRTSILLSSHDIDEVERLCDSIILLSNGQVLRAGSQQDLAALWQKWEFSAGEAIPPPDGFREQCRNHGKRVWITENSEIDILGYLTQHNAADIERKTPSLEEIFTILLTEREV